ncbi:MAG: hypothetical protein BA861_06655 [Desulfobacterales bacterium S3730MH5]|nr:MAG: hypothetical protein BA861_06655 [Desulfobacterales bacterium S3730MH5]
MNIERPTSNVEWDKKKTYDLEERLIAHTEIAVECSVLDIRFSFDVGRSMFDVGRSSFFISCFVSSYFRVFMIDFE